ncbi:hypothetical protein J2Z44_001899 [Clostridium punense]|uniref:BioF2-like acetyltransferase domain-containing protein n=1 Tax=Clostridium punense TaxID=1054297 RepID=A0ABS4K2U9_9CLOT|nr:MULTISPECIES: GNAT family N-acetyltransferase [Clostridium]EQB86982.1 hypothetical protein M918_11600 [Clostridium sp. BL8]MBP2022098.1 hypothetical protein [Clostridium punense]
MDIKIFNSVELIDEEWECMVENHPFLKRKYLRLLEETNPCEAKYYLVTGEEGRKYCFVSYKLKLNVFTYSKLKLEIPVTVIGIPASVSAPGYFCDDEKVILKVLEAIKGMKIILNSSDKLHSLKRGQTLPDCIMNLPWVNFGEYLKSMKGTHRYRYNKVKKQGKILRVETLEYNEEFSEELYRLYENVYFKSNFKLEKLPIHFFKKNGADTTVFSLGEKPVGFVQTFKEEDVFYFLFGGINYDLNKEHSLYFNMLYHIISMAIKSGAKQVKMGQTAEDAKLRLGCRLEEKYLYVHSSSRLLNRVIQHVVPLFSYRYNLENYHVFKENSD